MDSSESSYNASVPVPIGPTGVVASSGQLSNENLDETYSNQLILIDKKNVNQRLSVSYVPDSRLFDVCTYIIEKEPYVGLNRLQLLVYYCYAWELVWSDESLFKSEILAGPNGPLIQSLYDYFKGEREFTLPNIGASSNLSADERETIDVVLGGYSQYNPMQLSMIAQSEKPWKEARLKVSELNPLPVIPKAEIQEFYSSLLPSVNG